MIRCRLQRPWRKRAILPLSILVACTPAMPSLEGQQSELPTAPPLVFEGAAVVDVEAGRLVPNQTVVIIGRRIQTVGPTGKVQVPKRARVVDARGKYLSPGLWDMHVHVRDYPHVFFPLFIAAGVTGIREMGQHLPVDSMVAWRQEIAADKRVGPRLVVTGNGIPSIEDSLALASGRAHQPGRWPVTWVATPDDGRRAVDSLTAAGADFIKLHGDFMSREVYFAIAAQARRVGIPFAGHVPSRVTALEASDSGHRSIEHFNLFLSPCRRVTPEQIRVARERLGQASDSAAEPAASATSTPTLAQRCLADAARLARNGTWLTPTLAVFDGWLTEESAYLQYWPDTVRADNLAAALGRARVQRLLDAGRQLVGVAREAGLPLLAGTDVAPGATTSMAHHELALFVEAGLTPAEALRTATLNPAQFLGATDSLGTVAPGKLADLVLLDADPLTDIRHTTKIHAVVANGRYLDRVALDALLAERRRAAQHGQPR